MATRPLDAAFGGSTEKKSKKRGALLAVGIVAGLASVGSIFAASVSINNDADILFSQGTTTIAACDTNGITASLGAWYDANEGESGAFKLDTIDLSGVSEDCSGQDLTLSLYEATTLLVTVTGTISGGIGDFEVNIGTADQGLADGTAAGTGIATPNVVFVSPNDAADLAANADRIVIEIN
jgi:hypothetical protein